jgi:tetratricopeptide (TPR) repeat protein
MKWREILIGSVATLMVTVLSGVAVYYATKEPDEKKSERLRFVITQTAAFTGGSQDMALSTITIANDGGIPAKHLVLLVSFKSVELRDLAVSTSLSIRETARLKTAKGIRIEYDTLLPKESITLSLLLSGVEKPSVEVRSDASLGEEQQASAQLTNTTKAKANEITKYLVPVSGVLSFLVWLLAFWRLRRRGFFDVLPDRNNAGFLMLHHGITEEADFILGNAVRAGRSDQYTLSNYALCKAANGNVAQAKGLLRAANFRERTGHGKAVVLFNEALVYLIDGDRDAALKCLEQAIELSPADIRRYCQHSIYLDAVRSDPAFIALTKDA